VSIECISEALGGILRMLAKLAGVDIVPKAGDGVAVAGCGDCDCDPGRGGGGGWNWTGEGEVGGVHDFKADGGKGKSPSGERRRRQGNSRREAGAGNHWSSADEDVSGARQARVESLRRIGIESAFSCPSSSVGWAAHAARDDGEAGRERIEERSQAGTARSEAYQALHGETTEF